MCEEASRMFAPEIVAAFYDGMTPPARDGWALRERVIPIPSPQEGYSRVLFLGTTGAGKTTIVRQLIGTGKKGERFPSTSTAKTTTCDIEIITAPSDHYEAVVSFLPKEHVRQYVEECCVAAAISYLEDERPERTAGRFLEHPEQRFRLSYILGPLAEPEEDDEDEGEDADDEIDVDDAISPEERTQMAERLRTYLERVQTLATRGRERLASELDVDLKTASRDERDAFEELLEEFLKDDDEFHSLIDELMDDIEARFELLEPETLERGPGDWPEVCHFGLPANERREFMRRVNRFSSNQAPQFGKLLTPLVEGIRVRGPFAPVWNGGQVPKLVLMDGEGLGHAAGATVNLSTRITRRYQISDVILIADSAQQPMLAAPNSAIRSIVSSGQMSKLMFVFTHFDEVRGPNLMGRKAKEQHVLASLEQSIGVTGKELGRGAENALRKLAPERSFFLENAHQRIPSPPEKAWQRRTREALQKILALMTELAAPPMPEAITPVYDDANLVLCIQKAVVEFREPWRARLGLRSHPKVGKEHWARVKALTRRLGELGQLEYDTLRPVADFIDRLQVHVRPFLEKPLRWEPSGQAADEVKEHAVDQIAREVSHRVHDLATQRIAVDQLVKWKLAYAHRGPGSTYVRSGEVETIYNVAAPIPEEAADQRTNEFLLTVRLLLRDAIYAGGGKLEGLPSPATTTVAGA